MDEFTAATDAPEVVDVAPDSDAAPEVDEQPEVDEHEQPDDEQPADRPGREAAKYRRQLRETETALEAARETATAAQRALVEHLAQTAGRIRPAALWASGADLADLLDDSGNVDPGKVAQAADVAARDLGLTRTPRPDPTQGRVTDRPDASHGWAQAFAPTR